MLRCTAGARHSCRALVDVIVIFHFGLFLPFQPPSLTVPKIKFQKNEKKGLEISSFYTSVPKNMIICFTVPEIWHVIHVIVFHFGLPFALFPPNSPKNQNFKKMGKKKPGVSSFYICVPKIMIRWCTVSEIWCAKDGRTDEKSDT